jgi:hypothetical protein
MPLPDGTPTLEVRHQVDGRPFMSRVGAGLDLRGGATGEGHEFAAIGSMRGLCLEVDRAGPRGWQRGATSSHRGSPHPSRLRRRPMAAELRASALLMLQLCGQGNSTAMTAGPLPVGIWDRSSARTTSRTQCSRFSTCSARG